MQSLEYTRVFWLFFSWLLLWSHMFSFEVSIYVWKGGKRCTGPYRVNVGVRKTLASSFFKCSDINIDVLYEPVCFRNDAPRISYPTGRPVWSWQLHAITLKLLVNTERYCRYHKKRIELTITRKFSWMVSRICQNCLYYHYVNDLYSVCKFSRF